MTMQRKTFAWFVVSLAGIVAVSSRTVTAQTGSVAAGAGFEYGRANLVQGCNCFSLYGGAAQVQVGVAPHTFLLGDLTVARQTGLSADNYTLRQSTFMAGVRYFPLSPRLRVQPHGDALLGLAHAAGSLAPDKTGFGSSNTFALQLGGGVQIAVNRHLLLQPLQAGYLTTQFHNGGTNRQNQLRLSTGLLYQWK